MGTGHATVVDPGSLMSTGIPILIHVFFVALELGFGFDPKHLGRKIESYLKTGV